jgi:hypothetical protein
MSGGAPPEFFYIFELGAIRKQLQWASGGSCKCNETSRGPGCSAARSTSRPADARAPRCDPPPRVDDRCCSLPTIRTSLSSMSTAVRYSAT